MRMAFMRHPDEQANTRLILPDLGVERASCDACHNQEPRRPYKLLTANRALEGGASEYWTRFANPVSGPSAAAAQLRRPPLVAHQSKS